MIKKIIIPVLIIFLWIAESYCQNTIGIALPLMNSSGNDEDNTGQQMLNGINDALAEYNSLNPGKKIKIKTEDTKRDPDVTLDILNKFGSDKDVIAVFGPVYSTELANTAGSAAFHKIPVVSPTATQNFLAEQNENVFQLNPTYDIRGRIIAKYAMDNLGMKNFVILSEESYGKYFAESFSDEVRKSGDSVLFIKYYSKDKIDLTEEISEIRNELLAMEKFLDFGNLSRAQIDNLKKLKFNYSDLDSLLDTKLNVSIYKLFGKRADKILDSMGIRYNAVSRNALNTVFGYADAIYIPIANFGEISKVAPQYFSGNINLPVLGTSDWNNEESLINNKIYIKDLYFDSDFYLKEDLNEGFENLKESEIRNYYFGYDGMKFILDKISEGNNSRESLNHALESSVNYEAKHNTFSLKNRTNHHMYIMYFGNGKLDYLNDFIY